LAAHIHLQAAHLQLEAGPLQLKCQLLVRSKDLQDKQAVQSATATECNCLSITILRQKPQRRALEDYSTTTCLYLASCLELHLQDNFEGTKSQPASHAPGP
jgi:hypothetical protein